METWTKNIKWGMLYYVEKNLGVTFNSDVKVSEQCGIAVSKLNKTLGLIMRAITYKEKRLIVPLYKAIVKPHLEYCI